MFISTKLLAGIVILRDFCPPWAFIIKRCEYLHKQKFIRWVSYLQNKVNCWPLLKPVKTFSGIGATPPHPHPTHAKLALKRRPALTPPTFSRLISSSVAVVGRSFRGGLRTQPVEHDGQRVTSPVEKVSPDGIRLRQMSTASFSPVHKYRRRISLPLHQDELFIGDT